MQSHSKDLAFLDIETTGLSKEKDEIVCIGIFSIATGQFKQWIRTSVQTELALLQEVLPHLLGYKTFYIAGHASFDIAFLLARLQYHQLLLTSPTWTCISLFKLPLFKRLQSWGLKKRSSLEKALGYVREGKTSGLEIAKLAKLLCSTDSPLYEQIILAHNKEELLSCFYFYKVYQMILQLNKLPDTFTITHQVSFHYTIPQISLNDFTLETSHLTFIFQQSSNKLTLSIPISCRCLKQFLYPAKDYFYVPSQGELVHRSIAQFIPTSMREKVSQENCFVSQEVPCVPLYMRNASKSSQWVDEERNCYLPLTDIGDGQVLKQSLMKYLTQG